MLQYSKSIETKNIFKPPLKPESLTFPSQKKTLRFEKEI
jgi:hypothetical protein